MKNICASIFLMVGLCGAAQGAEYQPDSYRRAKPFMDGMLKMMDSMGLIDIENYSDRELSGYDWPATPTTPSFGGVPGSPYMPGMLSGMWAPGMPGQSQLQNMMGPMRNPGRWKPGWRTPGNRRSASALDGAWMGRSGEVLLIRDGQFRVYASRERFSDGKLRIQGNVLFMHNPRTNTTRKYEYATHEGNLVLRDADDQLLLYRRIRRPK